MTDEDDIESMMAVGCLIGASALLNFVGEINRMEKNGSKYWKRKMFKPNLKTKTKVVCKPVIIKRDKR
jgi:hypothetical protein